jgi:hypothetical protein
MLPDRAAPAPAYLLVAFGCVTSIFFALEGELAAAAVRGNFRRAAFLISARPDPLGEQTRVTVAASSSMSANERFRLISSRSEWGLMMIIGRALVYG